MTPSLFRYEKLLRWAESSLSAQGLDEEVVTQTLLRFSQPVTMETVRGEVRVEERAGGSVVEPAVGSVVDPEDIRSYGYSSKELFVNQNLHLVLVTLS